MLQAQGEHARAVDPHPARAHLEQGPVRARSRTSSRTRRRSSAPVPSRPWSGRRASTCAWSPTRTTGAAPPRSTRSSSRPTRTRTRWRRTSRPAPSRPAGTSRRRSSTALDNEPDLESIRAVTIGFDQLGFNCADQKKFPKSTGHPVLQDPAFRSALQWAVDKEKIVAIGYNGNAAPADTIITRDFYSAEADFHSRPDDPYTFDLDKAAAGARRGRLPRRRRRRHPRVRGQAHQAAPVRAQRVTREPELRQAHHRLVRGDRPGHRLRGDRRRRARRQAVQLRRRPVRPRLRPVHLGLGRRRRPELHPLGPHHGLRSRTGATATGRTPSTTSSSSSSRRRSTCRSASRSCIGCSRSSTTSRRTSRSSTRSTFEAANKGKWTGWVRANENRGAWWYNTQPDTYVAVQPGSTAPTESRRRLEHRRHRRRRRSRRSSSSSSSCCSCGGASGRAETEV